VAEGAAFRHSRDSGIGEDLVHLFLGIFILDKK
jgi:hypothetical protein